MQSGGGTTNTVQKSDPWAGAQPYLTDLMSQAQQTFQGAQGQTQLPNTYAGQGPITQAALNMTANRAVNGSPLINAADQSLTNILTPQAGPGTAALQGLLKGYADPGAAYTQAGAGANSALNAAQSVLGANNGPNPYLDAQFSAASKPVIDAVNAQAGMAGRTGSGAQQQLLSRNLGDMAAQLYGNNFMQEQQLGQNAAGQLASMGQNQAARQLQAGGQLSSNAANQASTMYGAANALNTNANTQNQQAIQASISAPNLAGQDYSDLQNLLNVGGAQDQNSQAQLNNILQQFQYSQQQPWNILSNYAGAISGLGGLGGSSTGSTTQPSQSALPQLIGTGISMLPFLMSDMRLKTDIRRVGTSPNGLGLYSFKFKDSEIPCIGLIAQEVLAKAPKAVVEATSGYLAVNYELALAA